jgi:radical SAM protein with 4Fe4S-binding SPASM domain
MRTSLVTNAVAMGKSLQEPGTRAASECEWVRVSLDAATADTYTRIRNVPPSHFDFACRAIRALREHRRDLILGVGFVVTPQNWEEIYDAAVLAKTLGASNIRIGAQFSAQEERLFEPFHEQATALAQRAEQLTNNSFTVFNRFTEKLSDLRSKRPDYDICGYQYFTTYIGADLNVYRCCVTAYNDAGLIGSIQDQTFAELWMDSARVQNMNEFSARSCERCQFNAPNRVLDYALRPQDPGHHEFV